MSRSTFTVAELRQFCHHFIGRQVRDPYTGLTIGVGRSTKIEDGKLVVTVRCNRTWRHRLNCMYAEVVVLEACEG